LISMGFSPQFTQPRSCDLNDLSEAPNLEAQHLFPARCQVVLSPCIPILQLALTLSDPTVGQQAIQIGVQRARSEPVTSTRLPFDRLHDSVTVQVRFSERNKNMKGGGR